MASLICIVTHRFMGWADTVSSFHSNGDLLRVDHLHPKDINIDDLTDWD